MRIARILNTTLTVTATLFLASTCLAQTTAVQPANFKYQVRGDPSQTQYIVRPQLDNNNNPIFLVPVDAAATAAAAAAQAKPPEVAYFHLEFALKQLDNGKVTSTRTYSADANTTQDQFGNRGSYRSDIGTQVPTEDGKSTRGHETRINIDWTSLRPVGTDAVAISINTQFDGLSDATMQPGLTSSSEQGQFQILARFGKPTVVFTANTPTPRFTTQLEVTATPIHLDAKP